MGTLVHEKFSQSVKSGLDLFALPSTQTSLDPQSVLADGAPVEFNICEEGEYYIDLSNLFLYARASIVKQNGENLTMTRKSAGFPTFYTACGRKSI